MRHPKSAVNVRMFTRFYHDRRAPRETPGRRSAPPASALQPPTAKTKVRPHLSEPRAGSRTYRHEPTAHRADRSPVDVLITGRASHPEGGATGGRAHRGPGFLLASRGHAPPGCITPRGRR